MLPPFSLLTSLLGFLVSTAFIGLVARSMLPELARRRSLRAVFVCAVVVGVLAHAAWYVGLRHYPTSYWGAAVASTELVLAVALAASMPIAALLRASVSRVVLPSTTNAQSLIGRRALLEAATASVPALALGTGAVGFGDAASSTGVPRRILRFRELPIALDGLRILQLSDLHLGVGRDVRDLERLLASLDTSAKRPDLIVLTGDIAEDLSQLGPALSLVRGFGARYGAFGILGNHEHLRGLRDARGHFDRGGVPLLLDEGTLLDVRGARVWLAGIDDPVIVHTDVRPLLRAPIEHALRDAPDGAFRILLSHRPEGFDIAARAGCELTLSGHTHGGQIGFAGKSAFEPLYPDGYLWGAYAREHSRLYTTSGFGAWFPFRLGCPSEAPILELRREEF